MLPFKTSSHKDPAEMLGGPVAPVGVAVVCHCVHQITASFDERKGTSYTDFHASSDRAVAVTCGLNVGLGLN